MPNLRSSIKTSLESVTKGWFNMEETNYEVYQGSKLKKLMELIKFAMQVSHVSCGGSSFRGFHHATLFGLSYSCLSSMSVGAL